jgi:actin-related protein
MQNLYRVSQVRKEGKNGKSWKESKKELVVLDKDEEEERRLRVPVRVIPNENAMSSSWLGASILGCTNSFVDGCFTKERYDEYGPDYILGGVDYEPPREEQEEEEEEEEEGDE